MPARIDIRVSTVARRSSGKQNCGAGANTTCGPAPGPLVLTGSAGRNAPSRRSRKRVGLVGSARQIVQYPGILVDHSASHRGIIEVGGVYELIGWILKQALRSSSRATRAAGHFTQLVRRRVDHVAGNTALRIRVVRI